MAVVEVRVDQLRRNGFSSEWTLILKEQKTDRYLPIYTGAAQAAIVKSELLAAIRGIVPKSLAPNLFLASINATDSGIKSLTIDRLEHNVFHAKLLLSHHGEYREVNCPPAMALALSLRADAPIFVEDDVLEKAALVWQ